MRVAVDAMGSDNAPYPEVRGAVEASRAYDDIEIILVGDQPTLEEHLRKFPKRSSIRVRHAEEVITCNDSPVIGVRQKKNSSILVALRMVKNGEAIEVTEGGRLVRDDRGRSSLPFTPR